MNKTTGNKPVPKAAGEPIEQYQGRLIRIIHQPMEFPDGTRKEFEIAERSPGVRILVTNGRRILLNKEWRPETNNWDFRLPGGKVFDSLEEYLQYRQTDDLEPKAQLAAQKELHEETGLELPTASFKKLYHSVCGASIIWDLEYFLVEIPESEDLDLEEITTHEGEQTEPQWLTFEEVKTLCLQGQVQEDRTVAVLLRYILSKS